MACIIVAELKSCNCHFVDSMFRRITELHVQYSLQPLILKQFNRLKMVIKKKTRLFKSWKHFANCKHIAGLHSAMCYKVEAQLN